MIQRSVFNHGKTGRRLMDQKRLAKTRTSQIISGKRNNVDEISMRDTLEGSKGITVTRFCSIYWPTVYTYR